MFFLITYRKNHEFHELEWLAPTGWSAATVRRCFEDRYSGAEIISFEQRTITWA